MLRYLGKLGLILYTIFLLPIIVYNGHFKERIKGIWEVIKEF